MPRREVTEATITAIAETASLFGLSAIVIGIFAAGSGLKHGRAAFYGAAISRPCPTAPIRSRRTGEEKPPLRVIMGRVFIFQASPSIWCPSTSPKAS